MGPPPVSGRSMGSQRRSRTSSGSASSANSKSTPFEATHPPPRIVDWSVSNVSMSRRAVSPIVRFILRLESSSGWFTASSVPTASSTSIMNGASGSVTRATGNRPLRFVSSNTRSNSPSGLSRRAQGDSPARASRNASVRSAPDFVSVHGVRIRMRPEVTVASCRRMPSAGSGAPLAGGPASTPAAGPWS